MKALKLALVSALVAASVVTGRAGNGDDWTIVQSTGAIWVQGSGDVQRISLSDGGTVTPGSTLNTGAGARVLLKRGNETMIVGPNTVMNLPSGSNRFYTTVVQITGAIEFDVEKRNVTHFAVKTPRLAAVVKGTHFVVRAGDSEDTVGVSRGRVEVQDLATGRKVDVLPGQRARVTIDGLQVASINGQRAELENNWDAVLGSTNDRDGLALNLGGTNGVSLGLGGGDGVSASVGGASGVSASVGGGSGVSASVGGSGGVGVSVGGGGIGIGIGGISIGLGGR